MYHSRMRVRIPEASRGPLLGALYLLVWLALKPAQHEYGNLIAGWRFGMLLLVPKRYWPWLIAADWSGGALAAMWSGSFEALPFALDFMPAMLLTAPCVALIHHTRASSKLSSPYAVVRLLAAALLAASLTTLLDWTATTWLHPGQGITNIAGSAHVLLGNYLGTLLVVPVLVMLVHDRPARDASRALLRDGLWFLLPTLAILLALTLDGPPWSGLVPTLALAPVLAFSFRHGWRGTAASMLIVSIAMLLFAAVTAQPAAAVQTYLFLVVAGTVMLMLGSAIDALRQTSERLAVQNARLEGANRRLDHLARRLSEAARRNLRMEEEQRRYMAAEVHDELGQNLTAIQTRVKLAQTRLQQAGLEDVGASINRIIGHMRATVRRMLDNLRPTVLDEFGLDRALEEGPIHDLLRTAGIHYEFVLHGDTHRLDEDTRIAVYRVAQEAATNAVRHAGAEHVKLRLRVGRRGTRQWVLLDIRDDGIGLPAELSPPRRGGHGLQSMRDRVTALGGIFRVRPCRRGTRLRILLRSAADDGDTYRPHQAAAASGATRNLSDTAQS